jgi:internalin A
MAIAETTAPKPRRRRLAVSVRTLMLLVLLACAALGWRVNRAHTQRRAVARIKAAGGSVKYDYEVGGDYPPKWAVRTKGEPVPWGPAWLRKWIGDEYFQEVTKVDLGGDKVTDESLAAVEDLDRIVRLGLGDAKNETDRDVGH